jgi:hypothetical protein
MKSSYIKKEIARVENTNYGNKKVNEFLRETTEKFYKNKAKSLPKMEFFEKGFAALQKEGKKRNINDKDIDYEKALFYEEYTE